MKRTEKNQEEEKEKEKEEGEEEEEEERAIHTYKKKFNIGFS